MKILWKYLHPQKWLIFFALVLATAAQLLALVDPIIYGKIIDTFALNPGNKNHQELVMGVLQWLGISIAIATASRAAKAFQDYTSRLAVQKFGMRIFNDGLKQALRLSYQEYEEQRSGEMVSVLHKVKSDTERFMNSFINILFSSLVGLSFLIWYAITKNWLLIPVFLIGILLLGSLTGMLSKKMKATQRAINKETNRLSGSMTESLRNIELVKSLGLTFSELRRLRDQNQKIFDLEMTKIRRVRSLGFVQGTTILLLKQGILFALLWLIFRDLLTPGELVTMQAISSSIFSPLQDLGHIILNYREVEASINNFDHLMSKPVEKRPEEAKELGRLQNIRFENVVFRHRTAHTNAIDDLSFATESGETIAFVGPSGSGKSTLVKLLAGLYRPVSGEIYYNEESSSNIHFNELRRQIGLVTQDTQLFAGSIRENLQFVKPHATDEEMLDALHKASCNELLARSSEGLDTIIGEGGIKLSGGEKQRLSIARALMRRPRLLIFDEATSALDSLTEESISATIRNISASRNQITILIAHRLSTIMHADVIYVLENGQIVETGTHNNLLLQKGLYYAMWRQQIGERRNTMKTF